MNIFMNEIVLLFLILFLGYTLGKISYKGFSLGSSGVLIISLFFGYAGYKLSQVIMDIGIILYVYAVGMMIGPRLFRSFKKAGWKFIVLGVVGPIIGSLIVLLGVLMLRFPMGLSVGLFAGTLTSTPALAKALDVLSRSAPDSMAKISSTYSIVYPFSMLLVVIVNQLLPKIMKTNLKKEAQDFKLFEESDYHPMEIWHYKVSNPGCVGKTIVDINPDRMIQANITHLIRNGHSIPFNSRIEIQLGDILRVDGPNTELAKLTTLLGEKCSCESSLEKEFEVLDVKLLNKHYIGRKIQSIPLWAESEVVVTRVRRGEVEIAPRGSLVLEYGDLIRMVGANENLLLVSRELQGDLRQLEQTNLIPFFSGLLLGVIVGVIPFRVSDSISISLGSAGGTFIVSILLGHFGRIRTIPFYVPQPVKYFSKEFGLLLFLAGAGTLSGGKIVSVLHTYGFQMLLLGIVLTIIIIMLMVFLSIKVLGLSISATMGALGGIMTNSPALSSAQSNTDSVEPTVSYASIYPVALITKVIIAQLLVQFFT
jgi:putative transport protein